MSLSLVIPADGPTYTETLPEGDLDRFKAMYRIIGGQCRTVTVVALSDKADMWLDEEGLYTQQPNLRATQLAQRFGLVWQTYHGTAIITGPELPSGAADLRPEQITQLRDLLAPA